MRFRTRSEDAAGWHHAAGWRTVTGFAVFSGVLAALSIWLELRVFALICLGNMGLAAFIGGYCFRQQVISTGRLPRFRWLWLKEDIPSE